MSKNRQALNIITGTLTTLDIKLGSITQGLEKGVFPVGQFVQLYLQLGSIIKTIRRTVWHANSYVEQVQVQFNMLSLGHILLSVIAPKILKGLLLEIENHLPKYLKLPLDPNGKIWKLYQTPNC